MPDFKSFSSVPKFAGFATLDPTTVNLTAFSTQTFTVPGLKTDHVPVVSAPNLEAGIIIVAQRVSAKDTLQLTFYNTTAGNIDPAAQQFNIVCL